MIDIAAAVTPTSCTMNSPEPPARRIEGVIRR
jgi:hypothetical protein